MESGMMTATGMSHDMANMDHSSMDMSGHVHDDPNSVLVEPGKTQELVWKFAATTGLEFACNVPGHYDSGMMGEVKFVKPGARSEEHTSELQSLMRISYAVFCLKTKKK